MPCCNRVLEEMIYRTSDAMINANINKCNTESYAQTLRNLLEKQFQTTFEIIVSTEDFAAKIRFRENLLCKTIVNEKIVLAYATPEPYALLPYNVEGSLTV
ncbi:Ground-like domain-containing protein [Aphelenchoides bicaudatus]|nr:Ground-like domain-containing protein [Aphelenchoides bicaudatus]